MHARVRIRALSCRHAVDASRDAYRDEMTAAAVLHAFALQQVDLDEFDSSLPPTRNDAEERCVVMDTICICILAAE